MASTLQVQNIAHTNGTTGLTVDSGGRVLLPQRVAFVGKKTDTTQYNGGASTNVTFNVTDLAHASWNGTTFTVPVAGLYRLFINGHRQSLDNTATELMICKNGTAIETAYTLGISNIRPRASCEALVVLTVNDAITFRVSQGNVYAGGDTTSSGLMCSGYLIG